MTNLRSAPRPFKFQQFLIPARSVQSEIARRVFEHEPNVPEALFGMNNVVLTPHVASATQETRQAMSDLVVENLVSYFKQGKAVTPVPECADLA